MVRFSRIDTKRSADVLCGEYTQCCLEHLIKSRFWKSHPIMENLLNLKSVFEKFGQKLLTGDRIIGQMLTWLIVALERN
ncbi:MAG: hypothetical protein JWL59_1323 [Chthoniobacteraceae bacterium]|nr:hypothetical protein [Chthoniobacteraceae bacterium]